MKTIIVKIFSDTDEVDLTALIWMLDNNTLVYSYQYEMEDKHDQTGISTPL